MLLSWVLAWEKRRFMDIIRWILLETNLIETTFTIGFNQMSTPTKIWTSIEQRDIKITKATGAGAITKTITDHSTKREEDSSTKASSLSIPILQIRGTSKNQTTKYLDKSILVISARTPKVGLHKTWMEVIDFHLLIPVLISFKSRVFKLKIDRIWPVRNHLKMEICSKTPLTLRMTRIRTNGPR